MSMLKKMTTYFIVLLLLFTGMSSLAIEKEESEEITRLQCIKEVIRDGCEIPETVIKIVSYTDGYFPLADMRYHDLFREDNYIVWAYEEKITYGKESVSDEEADIINEEIFAKAAKELDVYLSKYGLTRNDLPRIVSIEDGFCYFEDLGVKFPKELIFPNWFEGGLYFCPEEIATMEECVAFFVRSMKDDEIYKDLDVTWQYAKEIGFIKDSDNLTPDTLLTRGILDTLLERFKNYEHRDLLK